MERSFHVQTLNVLVRQKEKKFLKLVQINNIIGEIQLFLTLCFGLLKLRFCSYQPLIPGVGAPDKLYIVHLSALIFHLTRSSFTQSQSVCLSSAFPATFTPQTQLCPSAHLNPIIPSQIHSYTAKLPVVHSLTYLSCLFTHVLLSYLPFRFLLFSHNHLFNRFWLGQVMIKPRLCLT